MIVEWALGGARLRGADQRKIDSGPREIVEVIGEYVHANVGDYLDHFGIAVTGGAYRAELRVRDLTAAFQEGFGKIQGRLSLGVVGSTAQIAGGFGLSESRAFAHQRMR